jgi:hypothetical protein
MVWVLAVTGLVYLIVQGPLLYGAIAVHGRNGLAPLWGIAPNQFWFLSFVFPLATFCTFTAVRFLIHHVAEALPRPSTFRWILDHWLVALLWCLMLACVLTWIDYFQSVKSFDKLRPEYARRAAVALRTVRTQKSAAESPLDPEALTSVADTAAATHRLGTLPPLQFLRIVQRPDLQLRLSLLEPSLHALYTFQALVAFFVAFVAIFGAIVTAGTLLSLGATAPPMLWHAYIAIVAAVSFFAFWVLAFRQYRAEIEPFVGGETTILPDFFGGVAIVIVLTVLAAIGPNGTFDPAQFVSARILPRLIPIVVFVAGLTTERKLPELSRRLIGADTTAGVQLMWMVFALVVGIVLATTFWAQDLHPPQKAANGGSLSRSA